MHHTDVLPTFLHEPRCRRGYSVVRTTFDYEELSALQFTPVLPIVVLALQCFFLIWKFLDRDLYISPILLGTMRHYYYYGLLAVAFFFCPKSKSEEDRP